MFKFKLQKALEVKEREENNKRNQLLEKQKLLETEMNKLEVIEEGISETLVSYSNAKMGSLDIVTMNSYEAYLRKLKGDKSNQIELITIVEKRVEEAKEAFLEARREKKVLEKLREKSYEKYRMEELKEEQKFIDELSNSMFNRRK